MYSEIHNDSISQMQYLLRMQCEEFLYVPLSAQTSQKKDCFKMLNFFLT